MEMIDVLKKLESIAESKPELVADAVANVKATNPKEVEENAVESETPVNEYAGMEKGLSFIDFLKKQGKDILKLKANEYAMQVKAYKEYRHGDKEEKTNERVGGMSDIHIGAQEAIGEFTDEDGNLKMPKRDVVAALVKKSKEVSFPASYEYEVAARMVADDFDDSGEPKGDMEPAMDAEQPTDEGNEFAMAVQKAKAAGMKAGDKFKVGDKEYTLKDSDFEQVNTNTMENKEKEVVKEDIKMTADTPQEASMLMQILQMAGIKPMGAEMPSMEPKQDMEPETDGDEMAKFRNMVTAPDEEKAEETFANSIDGEKDEPKTMDTDELLNVQSGGLNRQKQQVRKEYPGDNPLAVKEDTISEQDVADSLRAQYESFKKAYQEAAKPDYIDLDKDGNKTEPMKKAAKDKEDKENK